LARDVSATSPLASICIPTFNGGAWLAECLASASAQTLEQLEILVLDDASTDDTVEIARAAARRDERIRVEVNPQRLGLVGNWNQAIRRARGEWIKLLFQDDLLAADAVARMIDAGVATAAPLVVCDRWLEFADGTPEDVRAYFVQLPGMDQLFGAVESVGAAAVCRAVARHPGVNFFGEPSAVLLRRAALQRFGGFNPGLIQLCDLEYWIRVSSVAGLARVRARLATFRIHGASASASNDAGRQFHKDVLDTLVLFHELAFDPRFEALRRAAAPTSFSMLAFNELQRARRDAAADPGRRRALDAVVAAHPKLGSPLWRLWHKMRKQLPSRS
jgi:glycosyltransferase involved in cell wall biosynthesis